MDREVVVHIRALLGEIPPLIGTVDRYLSRSLPLWTLACTWDEPRSFVPINASGRLDRNGEWLIGCQ